MRTEIREAYPINVTPIAPPAPSPRTYIGVFWVALATLMFEVLLVRIFSVTMWYHFAFVAISVGMFGSSVGAALVFLFPRIFVVDRTKAQMARFAQYFALAAIVAFLAHSAIPFLPAMSLKGVATVLLTYVVIAIPFVLSGICLCLAMTRYPKHVGKIYAADLGGAALGCFVLLHALDFTDAAGAVFLVAFLATLGAIFFESEASLRHRYVAWINASLIFVLLCVQTATAISGRPLIHLRWSKGEPEQANLYEKWNSFSRIRVFGDGDAPSKPFGWGLSELYVSQPSVRQLSLDIDSNAFTVLTHFDGDLKPLDYLKFDVTNLAYRIRPNENVLVVGAGGGRDVLSALSFGAKSVVAVEINRNILNAVNGRYGDFTGHLDRVPGVTFVSDDARGYIERSSERFGVIQISMLYTWAATAAGSFNFTENSVYTVEAWRTFVDHLSREGVLSASLWSFEEDSGELGRATSLAAAALRQRGVQDLRNHIVIMRRNGPRTVNGASLGIATLLVGRQPFSSDDLNALEDASARMGFDVLLSPRRAADPALATLAAGEIPRETSSHVALNLVPPTDDQPFLFFTLRPAGLWNSKLWSSPALRFQVIVMFVLIVLSGVMILLTALCILFPLLRPANGLALRGALPHLVFFAAIGAGFMMIEISQLQRMMIFLGDPNYALSLVLFVLLAAGGLGSFLSERFVRGRKASDAILGPLVPLVLVLSLCGPLTPYLLERFAASPTSGRMLVAGIILFPLGFVIGMPFPSGIKSAESRFPSLTPWLWAVNGAASVCGAVFAVIVAFTAGLSAAYWSGTLCYFVAIVAFATVIASARRHVGHALVA